LRVVEVRRNGDDGLGDLVAEVSLGVGLELHQDARRDLLRTPLLAIDVDLVVGAHLALDGPDRPVRVRYRLALRDLADEDLATLGERDHRGGRPCALSVGDDGGLATFKDGDDRVGRPEIDSYCLSHGSS
jgi:hypothetical protein